MVLLLHKPKNPINMKRVNYWRAGAAAIALSLSLHAEAGINFVQLTFAEAKAKAAKENKLVFIDAFTTWCGPCKWLSANVFTDEKVGAYFSDHFVCLKIDMESTKGEEIDRLYNITAYPTLLAINPKGELVRKQVGALDAGALLNWGDYCFHPEKSPLNIAQNKYKAGNREPDFLTEYLVLLAEENAEYAFLLPEIYNAMPVERLSEERNFLIFSNFPPAFDSSHSRYFMEHFEHFFGLYEEDALSTYSTIIETAAADGKTPKSMLKAQVRSSFGEHPDIVSYFDELIDK